MNQALRAVAIAAGLIGLASSAALAAPTPSSGTLTDVSGPIAWTDGPFTGANPTNNVPGAAGPNCAAVPGTCSDFLLTIAIPPGYTEAHPFDVVTITLGWPLAANDFDLYILNPGSESTAQSPAATSADPEIAAWPASNGTVTYLIRVLVFAVVNQTYQATAKLGPPGQGSPRIGQYALGTDTWSCNMHLTNLPVTPPPAFNHGGDGEPSVRFDKSGKFYVSAIAGVPAGSALWSTFDACGQAYSFLGAPDAGLGGGDTDIEVAPEVNALGNYNVYMSSLTAANITTAVSINGGTTFVPYALSTFTPVVDRQWQATYGPSIMYLSYRNGATQPGQLLEVARLDYTGLAAPVIGPPSVVWDPSTGVDPQLSHDMGNMVVDQRPGANTVTLTAAANGAGNVYHGWTEAGQRVFVSRSTDFGRTWTHHLVWDGGVGTSYDHKFTWVAVDQDGNVHTVFSDDRNVYLSSSTNQGTVWSIPVRVNRGSDSNIAIYPSIAAGSAGRVVIAFYGHSGTGSQDPSAVWRVFVSRCQNALAAVPLFEEVQASNRNFHSGPVCEDGLNCACCRQLTEDFEIDINPVDGSAALAYGSFGGTGTYMSRQVSGLSAIAGKTVPDRSYACPIPLHQCMTVTATVISRFEARPVNGGVDLVWSASRIEGVTGWNLYRGTTADVTLERVNASPIPVGARSEYRYYDPLGGSGPFFYRLVGVASDGSETSLASTSSAVSGTPGAFAFELKGANPFRGSTTLRYALPARSPVRIEVYNVAGQHVRTLVNRVEGPGTYDVQFSLGAARRLPAGVYMVRIAAGDEARSFRVVALD